MQGMDTPVQLVCPHCGTLNKVPAARLAESPGCGQCHQRLFCGEPVELTGASFQRFTERNEVPVVVDFWAPWCGPCLSMAPQYAAAAKQLEPHVRLAKLNTEAEPQLAGKFAIRSIPTMAVFRGGREVARQSGAMSTADIVRWVRAQV